MESIRKHEVEADLIARLESPLGAAGFEIIDLECRLGPRSLVRVFIERRLPLESPGDLDPTSPKSAAVTLQDCASATHVIESCPEWDTRLGDYNLEVSSPGLDRRLRQRWEFNAAVGKEIRVWLWEKLPGSGEKFRGWLQVVDGEGIEILVDRKPVRLLWTLLRKAESIWVPDSQAARRI